MVNDNDNNDAGAWVYYKLTYEPSAQYGNCGEEELESVLEISSGRVVKDSSKKFNAIKRFGSSKLTATKRHDDKLREREAGLQQQPTFSNHIELNSSGNTNLSVQSFLTHRDDDQDSDDGVPVPESLYLILSIEPRHKKQRQPKAQDVLECVASFLEDPTEQEPSDAETLSSHSTDSDTDTTQDEITGVGNWYTEEEFTASSQEGSGSEVDDNYDDNNDGAGRPYDELDGSYSRTPEIKGYTQATDNKRIGQTCADVNNRQKDNSSPTISDRPSVHYNGRELGQNTLGIKTPRENLRKIETRDTRQSNVNQNSISQDEIDIAYRSAHNCLRLLSADSLTYRKSADDGYGQEKDGNSYRNNSQKERNRTEPKLDENRRKVNVIYANIDPVQNVRTGHHSARDSRSHEENHENPITANRQKEIHENHSRKNYIERQQGLNGHHPGVREKHSQNSNHETHGNKYIYKMSSSTQQVPKYIYENQSHKENLRLERKQSLKEDEMLDRNRVANWEQKSRRNESGHGEYHRQIHRNKVIDMVVNETSKINDQDRPQGFVDYRHASDVRNKSAESKNKSRDINHTLNDTDPKLRNSNKSKSSLSCTRLLSSDTLNVTRKDKNGNKMDILKERKLKMEQEKQPESWYQYRNHKGEFEWRAKYAGEKCEQSEIIYENLAPKRPTSVAPRTTAGIKCVGKAITLSSEHGTVNANKDTRKYSEFDSPTQTQKGLKSDVLNTNKGKQRRTPEKCGKSKMDKEPGSNNKTSKTPQPKIVNLSLISPIQEKYKIKHKKSELLTLENIDLLNQSFNDGFVNVSQNKSSLNASLVNENKQKISEWLDNLDCTEDSLHKKCFTESDGGNVEVSLDKNKFEDKRNYENEEYRKGNSHKGLNRSERDSFDDSVSKPPSKRFKTGNKDTDASVKEIHKLSSGFIAKSNQHAFHERFKGMSKREMKAFLESDESGVSSLIDLKPKSNAIFVDDYSSFPGSPESDLEVVSWDGAGEDLNVYLDHQEGYTDTNWDEVRRDPSRYLDEVQGYPNVKMDKCRKDPSLHLKEIRGYPNANMDRVRREPSSYLKEIKGDRDREDLSEYYDEDMVYPPEYLDYVRRNPNKYLDEARGDQISYLGPASPVSDKFQYEMSNDRSFVSPNARQSRESTRNRDRSPRKTPYNAVCRNDKRASSAPTVRREVYPVKRVTSYFRENMNNQSTQTISDNRNGEYREEKGREVTNTVKTLMSPVAKQREQFKRPNDRSSKDTRIWCRQEEKRQDSPCTSMAKLKINTPRSRMSLDRSPFANNKNRNCSTGLHRRSLRTEASEEVLNGKEFKHHSEHNSNVYRQSPVKINAVIPRVDDAAYERPVSRLSNETFTIEPADNGKENYRESPLTLNNQRVKSKKNLFTVVGKNNIDNNEEVRHNKNQAKVRPTKQDKIRPEYRNSTPVRPEYLYSTPVRPGVRLSLNETFSTIMGSEETEMEQDEDVVLIEN